MEDDGKLSVKKAKKSAREIFEEGDDMLKNVEELFDVCIKGNLLFGKGNLYYVIKMICCSLVSASLEND